ncbi:tetratricopeptide repeat protein [Moorena sp. SIO4G3]|uniref:tetratricopeptide repeat protein n=1 Tax=Moorena sp. SIO4G3 TaxID=2607821 RepID=UPI0014298FC7|nr:tetratricopeptide repeat protein [Moorena sp. SIO4G3]NEO78757.1 tetratricopeptide repeat protein [Moorena sp. SIO4G3]
MVALNTPIETVTSNPIKLQPGLSLKYAYHPYTLEQALSDFNHHPCLVCGTSVQVEQLGEVEQFQLGSVPFTVIPKLCTCGYTNEVFIRLDRILQADPPSLSPSEEADLFPDPYLETGLAVAKAAIYQGKLDWAIEINRSLTLQFPQQFLPFYNLGVIYAQQQQYSDSLQAYKAALNLNPNHLESLTNKALVLRKLSRFKEAGEAYDKWCKLNGNKTVILAEAEGMFGTIRVLDESGERLLYVDEELQGINNKQPSAQEWEGSCRSGPGPVSNNFFVAGFLLMGCQIPNGSGLVIGLGCGAGAISLLANFPQMQLTIVEIDPVMIELCLTFFPLVQYYIDMGRLKIVEADVKSFITSTLQPFSDELTSLPRAASPLNPPILGDFNSISPSGALDLGEFNSPRSSAPQSWGARGAKFAVNPQPSQSKPFDFICLDAYEGKHEPPSIFYSVEFIRQMKAIASRFFVNIIGRLDRPHLYQTVAAFEEAGIPIEVLCPRFPINGNETTGMNWIGYSQEPIIPPDFVPFANLSRQCVEKIQQNLIALQGNRISRDVLCSYAEKYGIVLEQ